MSIVVDTYTRQSRIQIEITYGRHLKLGELNRRVNGYERWGFFVRKKTWLRANGSSGTM
ncbi:hypothetical protein GRF59_08365 [Paenibacillus sp. HJL G12]|uniref:Uncharacterized protein n=1 Tax=Paenibacillus dendrobii TaxID=2691084 RepID=A0A7X3IHJ7_9BACL|nr:hypothetical protein [Paenibacillus dendrobii]MWV43648.1 hypothetical protein [Paenibacillus dendrobii]